MQQNALKSLFAQPGAFDPNTGLVNQNVLASAFKIDPQTGMQLLNQQQQVRTKNLLENLDKDKLLKSQKDQVVSAMEQAVNIYDQTNGSPQDKSQAAQKFWSEKMEELKKAGYSDAVLPSSIGNYNDKTFRSVPAIEADLEAKRKEKFNEGLASRRENREERQLQETVNYRKEMQKEREEEKASKHRQVIVVPESKDSEGNVIPAHTAVLDLSGDKPKVLPIEGMETGVAQKISSSGSGNQPSISPETAYLEGEIYRLTGKIPSGGRLSKNDTAAIRNAADDPGDKFTSQVDKDKLRREAINRLILEADTSSKATALKNLSKQTTLINTYTDDAIRNGERLKEMMDKGIGPSEITWINKFVREGDKVLGDKDIPAYSGQLVTFLNEYSKVMSGALGNVPSTDQARREAAEILTDAYNKGQALNVIDNVMIKNMKVKQQTYTEDYSRLENSIGNLGLGGTSSTDKDSYSEGGFTIRVK